MYPASQASKGIYDIAQRFISGQQHTAQSDTGGVKRFLSKMLKLLS